MSQKPWPSTEEKNPQIQKNCRKTIEKSNCCLCLVHFSHFLSISGRPRFSSVRLRFGVERFERFRFSVPPVPQQKTFFFVSLHSLTGKDGSGFGFWKTVPAAPVLRSVSGKTVPTVPVPGSGSVPEPPCNFLIFPGFRGFSILSMAKAFAKIVSVLLRLFRLLEKGKSSRETGQNTPKCCVL